MTTKTDITLPLLPEAAFPGLAVGGYGGIPRYLFAGDQMQAYARAAVEADRQHNSMTIAHAWIRPALNLTEDAPYRFDFYAQKIADLTTDRQGRMPSDEEIEEFCAAYADEMGCIHDDTHVDLIRAALSRYSSGHPAAVRCNHCGWHGADADLVRDVAADEPDDVAADVCPRCKRIGDLQDIGQHAASAEPSGYAYRYPDGIRFNDGREVNGCKPTETLPYWFGAAPVAQEPVAEVLSSRKGNDTSTIDKALPDGTKLYAWPVAAQAQHPDDAAVDRFAAAMKTKLAQKRAEGRGGWEDKTQCSQDRLSLMLRGHVAKGDPVDVANFAMMLHQRGERISGRDTASPSAQDREDAQ